MDKKWKIETFLFFQQPFPPARQTKDSWSAGRVHLRGPLDQPSQNDASASVGVLGIGVSNRVRGPMTKSMTFRGLPWDYHVESTGSNFRGLHHL